MNVSPKSNLEINQIEEKVSDIEATESIGMEDLDRLILEANKITNELKNEIKNREGDASDILEKIESLEEVKDIIDSLIDKKFEIDGSTPYREKTIEQLSFELSKLDKKDNKVEYLKKIIERKKLEIKNFYSFQNIDNPNIFLFNEKNIDLFELQLRTKLERISDESLQTYLEHINRNNLLTGIEKRIGVDGVIEIYRRLDEYIKNREKTTNLPIKTLKMRENLMMLGDNIQLDSLVINDLTGKMKDKRELFGYLLENKAYIKYINKYQNDKNLFDEFLEYTKERGEKIKVSLLSSNFQNSNYILNPVINLEGDDYLDYLDQRSLYQNDLFDGLIIDRGVNKKLLILKLIEIGIDNFALKKIIIKNKIPYISNTVDVYIKHGITDEEKNYFNSEKYLIGKEKEKIAEKLLAQLLGDDFLNIEPNQILGYKIDSDNYADIIINNASKKEKEIIGNYLLVNIRKNYGEYSYYENSSKSSLIISSLIISLIEKGFKTKDFDLIVNQNYNYAATRIISDPNFDFSKLSPQVLSNELLSSSIILSLEKQKGSIEDKLKKVGKLNIENPSTLISFLSSLIYLGDFKVNDEKEGNKEMERFLKLLMIYSPQLSYNLTKIIIGNGKGIEDEESKKVFNKIKEVTNLNKNIIWAFGFTEIISDTAVKNKNLSYTDTNGREVLGEIEKNNEGLKKQLLETLDNEERELIKDILEKVIKEDEILNKGDIIDILYGIASLESKIITKEKIQLIIQKIVGGIEKYERKKLEKTIQDIPIKKIKEKYKKLFKIENGKIEDEESYINEYKEYYQKNIHRFEGLNDEEKKLILTQIKKEFLSVIFDDLDKDEHKLMIERLERFDKILFSKNVKENTEEIVYILQTGKKLSFEDFMVNEYKRQNPPQQTNTQSTESISNSYFPDIPEYNPISGTYSLENKTLSFSQDEISQINKNKENLNRILNFYKILDGLGLNSIWGNRKEIFKGLSAVKHEFKPYDDNYLQEHEVKMFLDAILISTGTASSGVINSDSLNLEQYIVEYKKFENTNISGSIKKDADSLDRSKMEAKFMNEFFPQGSFRFDLEKFIKAYNSKGESLERKS